MLNSRNIFLIFLCIFLAKEALHAQNTPTWAKETSAEKEKRMAWWTHDRLGLFLHFGLYSLPARHEWVQWNEKITATDYQKYFDHFDPDLFDPEEWAEKAKAAGIKYVVITTKHHEGFCLWDTKCTDFKVTNTVYGKDLLRALVNAFRARGIRIGFYYSLIDWHHPQFTYDVNHPLAPVDSMERQRQNALRNLDVYRRYIKDQLTELLTNYGRIDELFLDFSYPGKNGKGHADWDSEGLLQLIRRLQPACLVNNRLDLDSTHWGWDYITPEQEMPQEWPLVRGQQVPWETCQTFSGSWGYYRDEHSWKTVHQLVVMLIETVSKGGNLLLNVGPTSRGAFDERANERLEGLGRWMKFHSRTIYGCTQAPAGLKAPPNCLLTYNSRTKRLYVHILEWPLKRLSLPGLKDKISYAQLLNDGSEIKYEASGSNAADPSAKDLVLWLSVEKPGVEVPVIELFMK
ncbi:alpha-L-fucosidase [Niabella ginsenosidivorans]|uniref:alpha-L-fucosidase n=1 Tax=Niabella ginsenosidivorans TaxID=1176587 RepID=A0A1A9I1K7_9BACT|nr:alpha-L-fucosidase [Niabella ginsenosidivorans]ANH81215.1 alpha-L-fucosidase [Niabella ginsenosidivorans]